MSKHNIVAEKGAWALNNVVWYPKMADFEASQVKATTKGPTILVEAKRRSVTRGLKFFTHAKAWLDWAFLKTFSSLSNPKTEVEPTMIPRMDAYHIFLYLTMEILWIAMLLINSTIAEGSPPPFIFQGAQLNCCLQTPIGSRCHNHHQYHGKGTVLTWPLFLIFIISRAR